MYTIASMISFTVFSRGKEKKTFIIRKSTCSVCVMWMEKCARWSTHAQKSDRNRYWTSFKTSHLQTVKESSRGRIQGWRKEGFMPTISCAYIISGAVSARYLLAASRMRSLRRRIRISRPLGLDHTTYVKAYNRLHLLEMIQVRESLFSPGRYVSFTTPQADAGTARGALTLIQSTVGKLNYRIFREIFRQRI